MCNDVSTSGLWSSNEQALHINCCDSIWCSVFSSVPVLPRESLFWDNSAAISYMNNLGGIVPSLHAVSQYSWEWCLSRQYVMEAYHVPGSSNV